jgi:tetratricopeptide (TPR) repeat protein
MRLNAAGFRRALRGRPVMRAALVVTALAALAFTAFPGPSHATIIVVGGVAQSCYEAADNNRRNAAELCTLALEKQHMSHRDRAATYINRSYAYLMTGRPHEAIRDCLAALRLNPSLGEGYANHGASLVLLKRPTEAIPLIDRSIEIGFDKLYLSYFNRGLAKEDLGDLRGAYNDYKKSLELEPQFVLAQNELKRFTIVTR